MNWSTKNKVDLRIWFNQRNLVKITECSVMIGVVGFKIATRNSRNTLHISNIQLFTWKKTRENTFKFTI